MRGWPLALLLVSCGKAAEDSSPPPDEPVCPPDSKVTWESFAAGWIDTWCAGCHSANVQGEDRYGAPEGLNFDTLEEVVAVAPLIRNAASGELLFTMPPEGATRPQDRALLREWIDCGTPGESTASPSCATAPTRPGSAAIAGQAEADALCADGPVRIEGDLEVTGDADVGCACSVGGALRVGADLDAAALVAVGALLIEAGAGSLDLPSLSVVVGDLTVEGSGLVSLDLPELREVGADARVSGNPALRAVVVPRLATVGGALVFAFNPDLDDLSQTLAVDVVGDAVRIEGNDALEGLEAFRFASAVGRVEIVDNPGLRAFGGFELLAACGGVEVAGNPSLERIDAFDSIVELAGPLTIRDHASLAGLWGFGNLDRIDGDLTISNNPTLAQADVVAFVGSLTVTGAVDTSNNGP